MRSVGLAEAEIRFGQTMRCAGQRAKTLKLFHMQGNDCGHVLKIVSKRVLSLDNENLARPLNVRE